MKLINYIRDFIKSWSCEHEWEFIHNIYGDQINYHNGRRSLWECKKCHKLQYRESLYQEENINCQTFH